jgi:hypothetical protein
MVLIKQVIYKYNFDIKKFKNIGLEHFASMKPKFKPQFCQQQQQKKLTILKRSKILTTPLYMSQPLFYVLICDVDIYLLMSVPMYKRYSIPYSAYIIFNNFILNCFQFFIVTQNARLNSLVQVSLYNALTLILTFHRS